MTVNFPKGFLKSLPKRLREDLIIAASKYVYEEEVSIHEFEREMRNKNDHFVGLGSLFGVSPYSKPKTPEFPKYVSECPLLHKAVLQKKGFQMRDDMEQVNTLYKEVLELQTKAAKGEQLTKALDTLGLG